MNKRLLLILLVILAFGLIGVSLSTFYKQSGESSFSLDADFWKTSYGYPFAWHGYSYEEGDVIQRSLLPPPPTYWFSLESLLLDVAFWFAVSFFACVATLKSSSVLLGTKVSITYFLVSVYLSAVGLFFVSVSYADLGFRLLGIGLFLVLVTFYQSLAGKRRISQRSSVTTAHF